MKKIENYCVGCTDMGLPCLGSSCSNSRTEVYYCDDCGDVAEYILDGNDLCEKHAERYLKEVYNDLTVLEKAQTLGVSVKVIE